MGNWEENYQIDKTDKEIIQLLLQDAMMPFTEIASKINVSPGTVHVRMRKLKALGAVKGSSIIIDPHFFGYDMTAFLGVFLEKGSQYNSVIKELKKIPEVLEAYYTTGQYSIFVKLACRNTQHIRDVLNLKIQSIAGIQSTETFISLEESIKRGINLKR